jgi:lysophospholipase L1-like esterase
MKKSIICYGDSNTYGYDPRLGGEGRFPEEIRWTGILKNQFPDQIKNEGLCGRCIPYTKNQLHLVCDQLNGWQNREASICMWVMLGTNDLLSGKTAAEVALRMRYFLETIQNSDALVSGDVSLLLIAPPKVQRGTWVSDECLISESKKLGEEYEKLAKDLSIQFVDAGKWDIDVTFDGVHFSEKGHQTFAENIKQNFRMEN